MSQKKFLTTHIYTVELRLSGDELNPSAISNRLSLNPSNTLNPLINQLLKKKSSPYWAYNGKDAIGFQSEWISLEDGLRFLLRCVDSRKSEIITLARQFDVVWWCGHFQSGFNGGPTLSPELLTDLGSYNIPISIDNYFSKD